MSLQDKKRASLAFLAGLLSRLFVKSSTKPTVNDLKKTDFKTSTQDMGIRFTEKIRDVFRFRWIRKF